MKELADKIKAKEIVYDSKLDLTSGLYQGYVMDVQRQRHANLSAGYKESIDINNAPPVIELF